MQQQNNPEALEDTKQTIYTDPAHNAAVVKQTTAGGGTVVETKPMKEEKDEESYPGYQQQQQTTTTTTSGTYNAPATGGTVYVRRDVRPSPRSGAAESSKQEQGGGGFLGGILVNRATSRFFFALHAAIVFFSFLVFVSAALVENSRNIPGVTGGPITSTAFAQYEMTTAQTSFGVSLGALVLDRLGFLENRYVRLAISGFQVFFWVPALVIMTFFGSFISPITSANGFFGAWGALAASAIIFAHEAERTRRNPLSSSAPRASLMLVFFFSLMEMGAGIAVFTLYYYSPQGFNNPNATFSYVVYAIAFGAITAFLSVVMMFIIDTTATRTMAIIGLILWLWVAIGMLILTFSQPFQAAVSNGYYSCLFTLLASFGLLHALRRADERTNAGNANAGTNTGAPNTTTTTTNNPRNTDRASHAFFSWVRVMAFSGLVLVIAGSLVCRNGGNGCDNSMQRYQIAAGAVPLFFGLIVALLEMFGVYRIAAVPKIIFSVVMLMWWIAAFAVLTYFGTFQSPTTGTGFFINNGNAGYTTLPQDVTYANGYFFTWIGTIAACLAFAHAVKDTALMADTPNPALAKIGFLVLIILISIVTFTEGITYYYSAANNNAPNLTRYAISLGVVSVGLVLLTFIFSGVTWSKQDVHDSVYNGFLYILTLWWAVGALVLTFENFWSGALNNGYFSVFFALGACLLALSGIWREDQEDFWDTRDTRDNTNYQYQQETTTTQTDLRERRV